MALTGKDNPLRMRSCVLSPPFQKAPHHEIAMMDECSISFWHDAAHGFQLPLQGRAAWAAAWAAHGMLFGFG